jgi:F-type H+-transporting ATPase subunit gamma
MSRLREIKRRISAVNNISQVTHAMQLVAASRMRRAQEDAHKGKRYAYKIKEIMLQLTMTTGPKPHPMLNADYPNRQTALILVFSPQRGLAGSLPTNLLRFVQKQVKDLQTQDYEVFFITIGKKLRDQLSRRGYQIYADFSDMPEQPTTADIRPILKLVEEGYLNHEFGMVFSIYPDFINAVVQKPRLQVLLPLDITKLEAYEEGFSGFEDTVPVADYVYEPSQGEILAEVIPGYLETQVYQAKLESVASEYSARMVAMKAASDNAKSLRDDLTLDFNKSRQAQITRELAEVTSGSLITV